MLTRHSPFIAVLAALLLIYALSLQTIPNGSSHPYMIDVGETQVALHVWGVLHPTGYPLYTVLGNLFTPLPTALGLTPAAAASLFSALWTLAAVALLYTLLYRTIDAPFLAAAALLGLGLAQSIWVHSVVAEVYSLSLFLLILLWWVALAPGWSLRARVWLLAFIGGVAVAHHRALAFTVPALLWVLWPQLWAARRTWPRLLAGGVALALLGFAPYLYVLLRAWTGGEWLYADDLATWEGFWFFFWGREADYLVTTPDSLAGWGENLQGTVAILTTEITGPGLLVGAGALLYAVWRGPAASKHLARMAALSAVGYLVFAVSYHQAVLPEAIVMMSLPALAVGLTLSLYTLPPRVAYGGAALLMGASLALLPWHYDFIDGMTTDDTGLHSIAAASDVPRGGLERPVFMLSWGPRYFAANYSRLVTEDNADVPMVDHRADFAALAARGHTLYTEPDTLFGYPPDWWAERLGPVYLTSAGPNLVRLGTTPRRIAPPPDDLTPITEAISLAGTDITCMAEHITLAVGWYAHDAPPRDLSVKVHLTAEDNENPLAQADAAAPVHGWRPTRTWQAGELITDHYQLPRLPGGVRIILGLYEQSAPGEFRNYGDLSLASCD